jgi:hypothetical protein
MIIEEWWDLCMAELLRVMHAHDKAVHQVETEEERRSIRRSEIKALFEVLARYDLQMDNASA